MSERFSVNGDGKPHPSPKRRSSVNVAPSKPESPDEREQHVIDALSERYDELEAVWEKAEKELRRFRVYLEVKVCYNGQNLVPDEPSSPYYCEYLGFLRFGKAWRICHCSYFDESPTGENNNWRPIIDCPVDTRVAAIAQFEELRKKVIEAAEKCVPKLEKSIANFRKILEG